LINSKKYLFGKQVRLLNRHDYSRVFNAAKRLTSPYITLLYRQNDLGHPRVGLVIAKKSLAKAIQRNTFKRITRDSFRRHQHDLPNIDIVILSKKGLKVFEREALADQLDKLWLKLGKST
jgi:ribonuclease P protein component